jgi:hypothetical protein
MGKVAFYGALLGLGILSAASPANAVVYDLTVNAGCCGTLTSYGTVTATDDGSNLLIQVQLAPKVFFNNAGAPNNVLFFNLPGTTSISFSGLSGPFSSTGNLSQPNATETSGSFTAPPLTSSASNFQYRIVFDDTSHNGNVAPGFGTLSFDILGEQVSDLGSLSNGIIFGADIWNSNTGGTTGRVGAVPEPSTWAMMILGFLGVGFLAYRRRGSTLRVV